MLNFKRFREVIVKVLDLDEGCKCRPYLDSKGFWTIGRGHCIGKDLTQLKLPCEAIEAIFDEDLAEHLDLTYKIFGESFFWRIGIARSAGIFSLVFNMGTNVYTFRETIQLLKDENWGKAVANLKTSKWARDVDPGRRAGIGRDDRVIYMLENNEFPPEYQIQTGTLPE